MSEIELKFEVTADDLKRLARHPALAAAPSRHRLTSAYYDSPDFDLREAGFSLRLRSQDGAYVQTLKRGRQGWLFDRDEWEMPVEGKALDLAQFADTPAAPVLAACVRQLQPRFVTRIDRAIRLWNHQDAVIEIAVDKGKVTAEGLSELILELELELKSGSVSALYDLAEDLAETAPIRLSFQTKSERGLRLAVGTSAEARRAEAIELSSEMTAEAAFVAIAHACLVQVAGNGEALRREARAESLHQARIGLRRLRSAMSLFKPICEDDAFTSLQAEAKWAAGELDLARDLDVVIDRVAEVAADLALGSYLARLGEARAAAYARALAMLNSQRFAQLLLDAALWLEIGDWRTREAGAGERQAPVDVFAGEVLARLRKKVRKAGKDLDRLDAQHRHALRIAGKKLRYAAEFFESAFPDAGRRRRKFIAAVKALQDALGALNDIAGAEASARCGVFGRGIAGLAFTAGQVVGRMKAEEAGHMRDALSAYAAFRDAKVFWKA